jgi:cyclic pyranopterin phosphate synthase
MSKLTHLDEKGRARMVDVSEKDVTVRRAVARGVLQMESATLSRILEGDMPKGDVLSVARTAGIMAAKRTAELIPMCHPLPIDSVEIEISAHGDRQLRIDAAVQVTARTGVEMEALTAASIAALTVYDMCKAVDRSMQITQVALLEKSGGRSGHWLRRND